MKNTQKETAHALGMTLLTGGSSSCFGKDGGVELPYTKGFIVGGLASELKCVVIDTESFEKCFDVQRRVKDQLYGSNSSIGIGTWLEDEKIYFDIIQVVEFSRQAYKLCVERGEKAYYNISSGESVYIETEEALNTL